MTYIKHVPDTSYNTPINEQLANNVLAFWKKKILSGLSYNFELQIHLYFCLLLGNKLALRRGFNEMGRNTSPFSNQFATHIQNSYSYELIFNTKSLNGIRFKHAFS